MYKWIDIAFSLPNPFSFENFTTAMTEVKEEHAFSDRDYWQRVGMIKGVMVRDNTTPQEAYTQVISDMTSTPLISTTLPPIVKSEGCCGGGKVR
jgi:hypothetical protein